MSVNDFKIKLCELTFQDTSITLSGPTIPEMIANLICTQATQADDSRETLYLFKDIEKHLKEVIEYYEKKVEEGDY